MILEFALAFYGFLGTTITVVDGINKVLEKDRNCTTDDLFKRCFIRAVKRNSVNLNTLNKGYDPRKVDVDSDEFERIIKDLNNQVSSDLGMGEKMKKIENQFIAGGNGQNCSYRGLKTINDEKRIIVAKRGLKFVNEIMEARNIPAMMICRELVKIVEDSTLQKSLEKAIHEINESYQFQKI